MPRLPRKTTQPAAAAANKSQAGFDTILNYWKAKKVDDAITFAKTARDAAKTLADATDADAQAAARTNCRDTAGDATRPTARARPVLRN